ncbi:fimbria/pilus periplasmic chaperone [Klebsiella sp. MISC125]|uniref:fimbria/pilus periplasmic chaperone n=1 Tax=Klebsiella sp. MISC125 TaxID=2755386 RepID=UPI003DA9467E
MKKLYYKAVLPGILGFLLASAAISTAQASVTMLGTRVIYNGGAKSTDVQLRNVDNFPYVITAWVDDGNPKNGSEQSASVPFIVTPPVFRIQSGAGQILRIVYTGAKPLPQDRESLFWFNFMQVPPANVADAPDGRKQNGILVMLRNRVKLLYRPAGIDGNPQEILQNLRVSHAVLDGKTGVKVTSNQPFYVTASSVSPSGNKTVRFGDKDVVIPPFSDHFFPFSGKAPAGMKSVRITLINDQGARISEDYPL